MPNLFQSVPQLFNQATDWMTGKSNLAYNKINPVLGTSVPTSLFQSRITHTPGGFIQPGTDLHPNQYLGEGSSAAYGPYANPSAIINAQPWTDAEKAEMLKAWSPYGTGFIAQPIQNMSVMGTVNPDTMKHEQWHAIFDKAGLDQYKNQIAPLVPDWLWDEMMKTKTYQDEVKQFGAPNVRADEGTAYDLVNLRNRMGGPTPELRDKVRSLIKDPEKRKQFDKITALPGQSQTSPR